MEHIGFLYVVAIRYDSYVKIVLVSDVLPFLFYTTEFQLFLLMWESSIFLSCQTSSCLVVAVGTYKSWIVNGSRWSGNQHKSTVSQKQWYSLPPLKRHTIFFSTRFLNFGKSSLCYNTYNQYTRLVTRWTSVCCFGLFGCRTSWRHRRRTRKK